MHHETVEYKVDGDLSQRGQLRRSAELRAGAVDGRFLVAHML